ncbi:MAG TPA: tetratricopeptide repeat protein [Steroidobacteraceae bacterium]|jgi:predicted negative regulator of RcsB-dependent stress response
MVEDYLSDREQEEALRSWWKENWRWIFGGVALGLALLAGWNYWQTYRDKRAADAAQMYSQIETVLKDRNIDKAGTLLTGLTADFDSSAYAQEARLLIAKADMDSGKFDDAAKLLREVSDKSKDKEMARVAELRLARVLVQQAKYDEAVKLLESQTSGAYASQAREIRGDALTAKGDKEGARAEYAAALAGGDTQIDRNLLELKLQEVGGATATKAALEIPGLTTPPAAQPAQEQKQ